jgi:hypothetical protein
MKSHFLIVTELTVAEQLYQYQNLFVICYYCPCYFFEFKCYHIPHLFFDNMPHHNVVAVMTKFIVIVAVSRFDDDI